MRACRLKETARNIVSHTFRNAMRNWRFPSELLVTLPSDIKIIATKHAPSLRINFSPGFYALVELRTGAISRRIEIREKRALIIIYSQQVKDINLDQLSLNVAGGRQTRGSLLSKCAFASLIRITSQITFKRHLKIVLWTSNLSSASCWKLFRYIYER